MHFTLGGTLSTWMAIAKSNGTTIGRETGPATMDFTLPAAGTYYLIIEANNAGELGSYTIQVTP
jgi:hypothetical protein